MMSPYRLLLTLLLWAPALHADTKPVFEETVLFASGQGYFRYRIPAIVCSTKGTLLAFCEGRKYSGKDNDAIDIVLRRSTNNGASWLPMSIVQEERGPTNVTIGNPAPVVDETTGYIHLLFCRDNDRAFHTVSTNDGVTWSPREEITSSVKKSSWRWYATGPCHGIQLKRGAQAGRLVIPSCHGGGAHVVYSDDHGATWHLGAVAERMDGVTANENTCVELVNPTPDGGSHIYFNARPSRGDRTDGGRYENWSQDGGRSFTGQKFTNRDGFVTPLVEGSLLQLHATDEGGAVNRVLFSCPNAKGANNTNRMNLSIWSSTDEATSWSPFKSVVYPGPSVYSDMTLTHDGDVGLLYERGGKYWAEMIVYARFNEAWLNRTAKRDDHP